MAHWYVQAACDKLLCLAHVTSRAVFNSILVVWAKQSLGHWVYSMASELPSEEPARLSLAKAWEGSSIIRSRFRRGLNWLQYPLIPCQITKIEPVSEKDKDGRPLKQDPRKPTTRALELYAEVLRIMLEHYEFEFLNTNVLKPHAPRLNSHHSCTCLYFP